ncbi:MAG: hypothetical protein JWN79_1263, partial [Gemmatimonadetes bacterium]|nr:hypothetical protein [Gemmatimonadota bacterium]
EAAPVAALVRALGPASAPQAVADATHGDRLYWYLLVAVVLALLAETASRRFRGES